MIYCKYVSIMRKNIITILQASTKVTSRNTLTTHATPSTSTIRYFVCVDNKHIAIEHMDYGIRRFTPSHKHSQVHEQVAVEVAKACLREQQEESSVLVEVQAGLD